MESVPLIELKNLSHLFPNGKTAIEGISLTIARNSFTVICGENGCGKTVLMKHLNGILEPTGGDVLIDGISVRSNPDNARRKIGFVFQNSATQIIAQTVRDDIAFGPENLGCSREETLRRVEDSAAMLGIADILEQSPHRLSGGEKKKAAIAGILAMQPEMIVFDEPFAGLDYEGVKMLLRQMLKLHRIGTGIIVITHDLEKVLAHADSLIVLADGTLRGFGEPADLLETAAAAGMRIPPNIRLADMSWLGPEAQANE